MHLRRRRRPTKSQLPSTTIASGTTPSPSIARCAARRCASAMPSSSHSAWRRVTDRPVDAPRGDAVEELLPLGLGQHLRVAHLVDAPVARQHRRAHRERTCPRATPDLVDPDDDFMARLPQRRAPSPSDGGRGPHHRRASVDPGRTGDRPRRSTVKPAASARAMPPTGRAQRAGRPTSAGRSTAPRPRGATRRLRRGQRDARGCAASPPVRVPASAAASAPS